VVSARELIQYQLYGKIPPRRRWRPQLSRTRVVALVAIVGLALLAPRGLDGDDLGTALVALTAAGLFAVAGRSRWIVAGTAALVAVCLLLVCGQFGWIAWTPLD
jgi:hypothetical protein